MWHAQNEVQDLSIRLLQEQKSRTASSEKSGGRAHDNLCFNSIGTLRSTFHGKSRYDDEVDVRRKGLPIQRISSAGAELSGADSSQLEQHPVRDDAGRHSGRRARSHVSVLLFVLLSGLYCVTVCALVRVILCYCLCSCQGYIVLLFVLLSWLYCVTCWGCTVLSRLYCVTAYAPVKVILCYCLCSCQGYTVLLLVLLSELYCVSTCAFVKVILCYFLYSCQGYTVLLFTLLSGLYCVTVCATVRVILCYCLCCCQGYTVLLFMLLSGCATIIHAYINICY